MFSYSLSGLVAVLFPGPTSPILPFSPPGVGAVVMPHASTSFLLFLLSLPGDATLLQPVWFSLLLILSCLSSTRFLLLNHHDHYHPFSFLLFVLLLKHRHRPFSFSRVALPLYQSFVSFPRLFFFSLLSLFSFSPYPLLSLSALFPPDLPLLLLFLLPAAGVIAAGSGKTQSVRMDGQKDVKDWKDGMWGRRGGWNVGREEKGGR